MTAASAVFVRYKSHLFINATRNPWKCESHHAAFTFSDCRRLKAMKWNQADDLPWTDNEVITLVSQLLTADCCRWCLQFSVCDDWSIRSVFCVVEKQMENNRDDPQSSRVQKAHNSSDACGYELYNNLQQSLTPLTSVFRAINPTYVFSSSTLPHSAS